MDAAVHFAAAGKWADAAAAFVTGRAFAHPYGGPGARRLLPALADMPADTPGPQSAVVLAALAVARGDAEAAAKQLGRAEELVEDPPPGRGAGLALALAVVGAGVARLTADAGQALAARDGLDRAATELAAEGTPLSGETRASVLAEIGGALLGAGRLDVAATVLAEAGPRYPRVPAGSGRW